jgi:hypothetical protein
MPPSGMVPMTHGPIRRYLDLVSFLPDPANLWTAAGQSARVGLTKLVAPEVSQSRRSAIPAPPTGVGERGKDVSLKWRGRVPRRYKLIRSPTRPPPPLILPPTFAVP